jgi:adenylate kinase
MSAPIRIILLGPPGAGKGTQAALIAERHHAVHVSTGDIFRAAVKKRTPLGLEAKRYMDRGQLVPDATVIGIVEERLGESDTQQGFVLDGFPRTVDQAQALEAIGQRNGYRIAPVVNLVVSHEDVVKRLSGRRVCRECGAMYHQILAPPTNAGLCNRCNGELYQRDDDHEDTILARLDVYTRQTDPLVQHYRGQGVLVEVDGTGQQDAVAKRIAAVLDGRAQ